MFFYCGFGGEIPRNWHSIQIINKAVLHWSYEYPGAKQTLTQRCLNNHVALHADPLSLTKEGAVGGERVAEEKKKQVTSPSGRPIPFRTAPFLLLSSLCYSAITRSSGPGLFY